MNKITRNILIGITVIVMAGTAVTFWKGSPVEITQSGTDLGITFKWTSRITITQSGTVHDCEGKSISGVTVEADNVTVRNCLIEDAAGTGIEVHGNNNTFENIDIDGVTISDGDVDGVRFFGSGHVFRNISVKNIKCVSPTHCDGFQTWGDANHVAASNITFDGVEVYNFSFYKTSSSWAKSQCFMIESDADNANNVSHDILITNSVLNCFRTVNIGDSDDVGTSYNINFYNNTVIGEAPTPITGENSSEWGVFCTKCSNITVQGNIFYNVAGQHLLDVTTASHNLVYRTDGGRLYEPQNPGDLWGIDPLFIDPDNGDYRLSINSPARGMGADGRDLGAFQFAAP